MLTWYYLKYSIFHVRCPLWRHILCCCRQIQRPRTEKIDGIVVTQAHFGDSSNDEDDSDDNRLEKGLYLSYSHDDQVYTLYQDENLASAVSSRCLIAVC